MLVRPVMKRLFFRAIAKNGSSRSVLGQKRVGRSAKAANTQFGLTWLANTTFHTFLVVHRPGPPGSRYFGQLPRFWPHFVAFCCSSPVYSIWPAWRRTTPFIRERQKANGTETKSCSSTAARSSTKDSYILRSNISLQSPAQQQLIAQKIRIYIKRVPGRNLDKNNTGTNVGGSNGGSGLASDGDRFSRGNKKRTQRCEREPAARPPISSRGERTTRDVSEVYHQKFRGSSSKFRRSSPRTFGSLRFYTYHTWYQVYSLTPGWSDRIDWWRATKCNKMWPKPGGSWPK